jgi:hypothetical protein
LLSSIDEKKAVRRDINLRRIFEQINTIDLSFDLSLAEFDKSQDGNTITIRSGSNTIKIEKDPGSDDSIIMTIFRNGKARRPTVPLTIKEVNKRSFVYYEGIFEDPTQEGRSYLSVTLKSEVQKEFDRLKSVDINQLYNTHNTDDNGELRNTISKSDFEDLRINLLSKWSERKNWRYSLNTRGLMLYLLAMIKEENKGGGRKRNVEISNVLENLSDNFQKEFPFLIHYKDIKDLYEQVPKQKKSQYAYFQVTYLKQIALELQNQIDTIDKEELHYYIIKRYYEESSRYFVSPTLAGAPLPGLIRVIPDPVRKYLVTNLLIMRDYLRTKLQEFEYNIERFSVNA